MNKVQMVFNVVGSLILSSFSYFMGGIDKSLIMLITIIAIDYITGICKAIIKKEVNSIIGIKGIIKKFGYLMIVALAVLLDKIIGDTSGIRILVIYFFIANEGISILENWSEMGLPLPKKIFQVLEQLKEKVGDTDV